MTEIDVDEYDDLRGDEVLHSKGRDVVLKELESGTEAVLWMEDWLVDEKELDPLGPVSDLRQLFTGRKVAETDAAFLITQTDDRDPDADAPGTEWVPKSSTRLYVRGAVDEDDEDDREYPSQRGLTDF
jgi:hypothetical protein